MSECRVVGSGIPRPRGLHALKLAEAQNLYSSETTVILEGVGNQIFILCTGKLEGWYQA